MSPSVASVPTLCFQLGEPRPENREIRLLEDRTFQPGTLDLELQALLVQGTDEAPDLLDPCLKNDDEEADREAEAERQPRTRPPHSLLPASLDLGSEDAALGTATRNLALRERGFT